MVQPGLRDRTQTYATGFLEHDFTFLVGLLGAGGWEYRSQVLQTTQEGPFRKQMADSCNKRCLLL
jgi:hypothetical protein